MPPRTTTRWLRARRGAAAASLFAPSQTPLLNGDARGRNVAEMERGSKHGAIGLNTEKQSLFLPEGKGRSRADDSGSACSSWDGLAARARVGGCAALPTSSQPKRKIQVSVVTSGQLEASPRSCPPETGPASAPLPRREPAAAEGAPAGTLLGVTGGCGTAVPAASRMPARHLPPAERRSWKRNPRCPTARGKQDRASPQPGRGNTSSSFPTSTAAYRHPPGKDSSSG